MNSDPTKPRFQCEAVRERAITSVLEILDLTPEQLTKSCLNCDNFDEATETCTKFNARPPARIIAYSCPHWYNIDDEIPF